MKIIIRSVDTIYPDAPIWEAKYIPLGIRWWEKILLWFKPAHFSCDDHMVVKAKWLFGNLYIIDYKHLNSKRKLK